MQFFADVVDWRYLDSKEVDLTGGRHPLAIFSLRLYVLFELIIRIKQKKKISYQKNQMAYLTNVKLF